MKKVGQLGAHDQVLIVDGFSLFGHSQERAAELMTSTSPMVTLEVANQGILFHCLSTFLTQPLSSMVQRGVDPKALRTSSGTMCFPRITCTCLHTPILCSENFSKPIHL
nr:afadin-like isoform X1 [Rattus norvegicus]